METQKDASAPPYPGPPEYGAQAQAHPDPQVVHIVTAPPGARNCPVCHIGFMQLEQDVTRLIVVIIGVIFFFPIGLLYLLCLRKVPKCGACGYHL